MTLIAPAVYPQGVTTMAQAPETPWRNDDEAAEYIADPKEFLLNRMAFVVEGMKVGHNWVLCATYWPPDYGVVTGGHKIFVPDSVQYNALGEGKCGVVIAKGPLAFVDDETVKFRGFNAEIGDWVIYGIQDRRQLTLGRMHCCRLKDVQVFAVIGDPRLVY